MAKVFMSKGQRAFHWQLKIKGEIKAVNVLIITDRLAQLRADEKDCMDIPWLIFWLIV